MILILVVVDNGLVLLRKTVISQANEILELNGSYTAEGHTMFVGLRK